MSIKVAGLDKLQKELSEMQYAIASLDGKIATLRFNPGDPASVQRAIREMESAVDQKTARYRSNPLVANIAKSAKAAFRKKILETKSD